MLKKIDSNRETEKVSDRELVRRVRKDGREGRDEEREKKIKAERKLRWKKAKQCTMHAIISSRIHTPVIREAMNRQYI
jgi:hypothetical protein